MLRDVSSLTKIYIACGHTDLRKGIDGLASLVKEHFRLDPFQKDVLFLFCGSRMDRFKEQEVSNGPGTPQNSQKSLPISSESCWMVLW